MIDSVYIVFVADYDGDELKGVYGSMKGAEQRRQKEIAQYLKKNPFPLNDPEANRPGAEANCFIERYEIEA